MLIDKKSIRKQILRLRDSISDKAEKDEKIREALIKTSEFKNAEKILFYASFRGEVDTFELMRYCLSCHKKVALPKVEEESMSLKIYEIKDISELSPGYMGIPEPDVSEDRFMHLNDMDLIIVPGVAFDEDCNRLGYGKGFYDKLLSGVRNREAEIKFIGVAYDEQVVKFIPSDKHDIKIRKIITDKRIIECHGH